MAIDRRTFLRGGLAAAGLAGATRALSPLIRVKPAWGGGGMATRRVVVVGIGGGLRLRESLGMAEGATMPNLFGTTPLISGFGAGPAGAPRIAPEYAAMARPLVLPAPRATPLHTLGTLVTNLRYADGPPGHLQGHGCLLSGAYNMIENRADARLTTPTIFEVHRKGANAPATDAWYLTNPGGFYRALLTSGHPLYGPRYAPTYLQPPGVMSPLVPIVTSGKRSLDVGTQMLPTVPQDAAEDAAVTRLTAVLDANTPTWDRDDLFPHADVDEASEVQNHVGRFFADPTYQTYFPNQFGIGMRAQDGSLDSTDDALTVFHAERVLDAFQPALLAMTLLDVDTCHQDFNGYLRAQQIADAAVNHLWNFIQAHPSLRDETTLIVMPEHGRHLFFNGQNPDSLGRSGIDHGQGDDGDRNTWVLMLGPDIRANQVIAPTGISQTGRTSGRYETIDAVMTGMTLLGHGDRLKGDLETAQKRPGLVVQEVLS
ncbi:MAG TPA: hypothetical protein VM261_35615 [Kofleriaceae bacterium]|nr:hypothetical protein [Kofleriaceae bacterium]